MPQNHFPNPIRGYFDPENTRKFTLTAPFTYQDEEKDLQVVVPAGFETDFNSVPGAVWAYFAPWEHPEAGVVHDWLYKRPDAFQSHSVKPPMTRQQVDDIHRRILHLKGVRWTKRQLIYWSIRSGGWVPWGHYRQAEAAKVVLDALQDVVVESNGDHKSDPKNG